MTSLRLPLRHLAIGAAVGALALTGCSTGSTDSDSKSASSSTKAEADAFPVTIEHAFGKTTIEKEPKRVATLGWSDQDHALALGVVPVGATKLTWGGNKAGSSDWFDAALEEEGAEAPVRYDDADGAPIDEIAKLSPDVILATNSGITEQEYEKLTKIAPVVAYPEAPWVTPWQTSLETVGKALGRTDEAEKVEDDTEEKIDAAKEDNPELDGQVADLRLPRHHRPVHGGDLRAGGPAGLVHARPRAEGRPVRRRCHQAGRVLRHRLRREGVRPAVRRLPDLVGEPR